MCINYFDTQINTENKIQINTETKTIYIDQTDLQSIYNDSIAGESYEDLTEMLRSYSFEETDGALLWYEEGYDYTDPDLYRDLHFASPESCIRFIKLVMIFDEIAKNKNN